MNPENRLLGNIETGLDLLRHDLSRVEAKIDSLFDRLDKRVVKLETLTASHSSQLAFIYGIGAVLSLIFSGLLTWLGIKK